MGVAGGRGVVWPVVGLWSAVGVVGKVWWSISRNSRIAESAALIVLTRHLRTNIPVTLAEQHPLPHQGLESSSLNTFGIVEP